MGNVNINLGGVIDVAITVQNQGNVARAFQANAWVGLAGSGPGSPTVVGMSSAVQTGVINPGASQTVTVRLTAPTAQVYVGKTYTVWMAVYGLGGVPLTDPVVVYDCGTVTFPAEVVAASINSCSVAGVA